MTTKKIRVIGKKQPRVRITGKALPVIEPEEVRKALGAEKVTKLSSNRFRVVMGNPITRKKK